MLCVIAKFDDASTEKLTRILNSAFSDPDSLKPVHGHITVATYMGSDENGFIRCCREILEGIPAFSVNIGSIEVFTATSVIVAVPEKNEILEKIHRGIASKYEDELNEWTRRDRWEPHSSLFYEDPAADLNGLRNEMMKTFAPFSAQIERIEFSKVLEKGFSIADRVALRKE